MPVCYRIDNDNFTLGLWNINENEDQLLESFSKIAPHEEILKAEKFKYSGRKKEWIATRLLVYNLLNEVITIEYDPNGKPIIYNNKHSISISHTKGMVAVIIAQNMTGIDIELINDRILRIENKFMSGIEKSQIPENTKHIHLLAYWSAKETLYKISGGKNHDFIKNLYINPFKLNKKGEFIGEIVTNNQTIGYQLNYFIFDHSVDNSNYLIVYYYN